MQTRGDIQIIVQAAIMYYKEHMNQQEIAERLGLARQTVSKLLRSAEEYGIVEFRIHNPTEAMEDMSSLLARRYHLTCARVIPCQFEDSDLIASVLGQYAAGYVLKKMESGSRHIGISWGRTIYQMVTNLSVSHCDSATIFPLVGASSKAAPYFMINEMVRLVAGAANATPVYAYIPADTGSREDAALFKRTSTYETISSYWNDIDLAVMGIGVNPRAERRPREAYPGEKEAVIDSSVGDILTHYFDAEGRFVPESGKILCASVDNLKNAKTVLAVAGGSEKVAAIHSALKTGVVTELITDQQTCSRLFKISSRG